ncbi:asparagine synthase (glutamine-hydrolyzing) [Neorhizobium sp. NPDC001467]|uniref:asparagine synthase (glutamine-hydrolyzing) n=1 Tax=Neorhizobium sp. NPDC001467 TaxID=3390595 RepID=UPI003D082231
MCGFAGFLGDGVPREQAPALLAAMADAIAHRGPDERGIHAGAGLGLAHVRLSIVGLGDGQQPMALREGDDDLTIVFNGEIYNYVELGDALKADGHRLRSGSDTEVILHLYRLHGDDCLAHLNGDFAFAIWDARRRRMLLARDRMGVRPLFYAQRNGTFYFGSEVKALLEAPGIVAELDPFALDQIFTLWAPIAPRTAFRDIFELEPASRIVVEDGRVDIRPYWQPQFPDAGDHTDMDADAAAEALHALLTDATRLRMRADVPVGAYLSGGLDSSLITAIAAPMAPGGLNTFSVTFDSAEHDESRHQTAVAAALGTRHNAVACGPAEIAGSFKDVIRFTERPIIRTAPAPLYRLSGLVRARGMKVVLTGEGADEVFAGYDIFKEAKVRRFCARQPGSTMRPHLFKKLYPYLPGLQQQSGGYLSSFFGTTKDALDDPLFALRPRLRNTGAAKIFFSAALKEQLAGYDAAEELAACLPADFSRWHVLNQAQYLEMRFLLPGYILSSQGDRMAMAHGIEGRFPFLDYRLVEFANSLPPGLKLKGLEEKHILRRVARDLLPPAVAERPKQPYRAPDSAAFLAPSGLAPSEQGLTGYVKAALDEAAIAKGGLFDPKAVAMLARKCEMKPAAGFRDNAAFVGIISTQLWQQTFTGLASGSIDAACTPARAEAGAGHG